MLKKVIAIKNVGRFRNSAAPGNPHFAKHTFITGANGYGKTTICAILRSLGENDPSHILGRKTLGVTDPPTVELLLESGAARFDGSAWNATLPGIAVFDGVFVAANVHSGEIVDIEQKRNLYRVIVGDDGVRLATADAELAAESRAKTTDITAASKAVQPHVPAGMKLESFLTLAPVTEIDARVAEQLKTLEAVRQAGAILDRPVLAELSIPGLPAGIEELLSRTIDDIAKDAESQLAQHLAAHDMTAQGESWIAVGIENAGDSCPFCGQDIHDLSLIAAFRAVFSGGYKALTDDIKAMRTRVIQSLGDAALARIETTDAQNKATIEFWSKYCTFDAGPLAVPAKLAPAVRGLLAAVGALLDRKAATPLEAIAADEAFTETMTTQQEATHALEATNAAVRSVNALIAEKKATMGAADLKIAETELALRKAVKARHTAAVDALCVAYSGHVSQKEDIDKRRESVRTGLDVHTRAVVKPYERRINDYLLAFNAGFNIAETKHTYPAGIATSSYQLVINNIAIDVGDGKTPAHKPSFKNTLSAGDRTTLALAFFLAHLERDPTLARKVVVFDDPFNSQDSFRRRQTVHEIMKVARACAQVIVLSHDATFLKQVWDKSPADSRVALTIVDHRSQGSKIMPVDLDKACQGRTATDIDDLQTYLTTGAGALLDLIRKMRVVLETYSRTTYPSYFLASDWLGDIVRKIRESGEEHPAHALYDELDQINGYTSQYHHGENVDDTTPDQIDPTELTGYIRRTLRQVNALQA